VDEILSAKCYLVYFLYEKSVTCKRDPKARDETETFPHFAETVSRPRRRDRDYIPDFYRAMHFSAKRGVDIARSMSVRLSVCQ